MLKRIRLFLLEHEAAVVIAIIVCGALLRTLFIGMYPAGLDQDEASAGYAAWSLLHYGIDQNGVSWPVLFISWGSGQNVLYSYLSMPIIAILGLNVFSFRLLAAVLGTATLPIFWHMSRKLKGPVFALGALALLAFCPWHIMISRWALESNLLPFFLLLGIYFTVLSFEKPNFLIAAGAAFGLSLYAYGTAFLFLPVFLVLTAAYLRSIHKLRPKQTIIAAAVFFLIGLPVGLCNLINIMGWNEIKIFDITLPVLTQTRQLATISFSPHNFVKFIKLLVKQTDGYGYNSVAGFLFFPFYYVFAAAGVVFDLRDLKKNRDGRALLLIALLSAVIDSFFIHVNINRMNMAFLPIAYFTASGLWGICRAAAHVKKSAGAVCCCLAAAVIAGSVAYAGSIYVTKTQAELKLRFADGLGAALEYADTMDGEISVTSKANMPYIYVLFYDRIPPEDFCSTVLYRNPDGAFRQVLSFGRYRFDGGDGDVYVLRCDECGNRKVLARFGYYVVCV